MDTYLFHDAEFVGDSLPVDEMDMCVFRNVIFPKKADQIKDDRNFIGYTSLWYVVY